MPIRLSPMIANPRVFPRSAVEFVIGRAFRSSLVDAAALCIAEIERIDRASSVTQTHTTCLDCGQRDPCDEDCPNHPGWEDCKTCGGSGFSERGTGYDDVCGECGGLKRFPVSQDDEAGK